MVLNASIRRVRTYVLGGGVRRNADAEAPERVCAVSLLSDPCARAGGTACHSAISPPPPRKRTCRPMKRRVRKSPEFEKFNGANFLQMKPQTQLIRPQKEPSKRGKIESMSHKSMVNLKRKCAQVISSHKAYTFCLSYGEQFPDARGSKDELVRLQRWVSNNFREYGMFWKREPQKRGATHYHILAFLGDDEEAAKEIGLKILIKWCEIANDKYGADQFAKALNVHTFIDEKNWGTNADTKSNFQLMKGANFFNYLSKYISKSQDAMPEGYDLEGGGKWWGYFNKSSIPWAESTISNCDDLDRKKSKMVERIVYRIRQSRANVASDRATSQLVSDCGAWSFNGHSRLFESAIRERLISVGITPTPKRIRKITRQFLDPQKRWRKAKKLRREGSVTLLGNIDHISSSLCRFMNDTVDHSARSRIFGDSWSPPENQFEPSYQQLRNTETAPQATQDSNSVSNEAA